MSVNGGIYDIRRDFAIERNRDSGERKSRCKSWSQYRTVHAPLTRYMYCARYTRWPPHLLFVLFPSAFYLPQIWLSSSSPIGNNNFWRC